MVTPSTKKKKLNNIKANIATPKHVIETNIPVNVKISNINENIEWNTQIKLYYSILRKTRINQLHGLKIKRKNTNNIRPI